METHTFEDLIIKTGLYEEIPINSTTNKDLLIFFNNNFGTNIDMHCIHCKKDSTFHLQKKPTQLRNPKTEIDDVEWFLDYHYAGRGAYNLTFNCSRDTNHKYVFAIQFNETSVFKIGQFPAVASLEKNAIGKYKKLLNGDYENLNRAIGLRSHGIGAGSYVYLRRIFENLIEEIHQDAKESLDWDEDKYIQSRMKEKIKLLEHKLPRILVETPELYGILSKGIHELSEEQCLEFFPVTKYAIELILDEKLVMLEKENKMKELKTSLSSIAATITK